MEETVLDLVHRLLPACRPANMPDHARMTAQRLRSEAELYPLDVSRRYHLACLLLQLKDYHGAEEVCTEARSKDTRRTLAQLPLLHGIALMFQKRHAEADMCFKAFSGMKPNRFEGPLMSAINHFVAGNHEDADMQIAAAMGMETRHYHSRLAKARFHECRRMFTEAIKLYEEILREDPEDSDVSRLLHKAVARNRESQRFIRGSDNKPRPETGDGISFGR